MKKTIIIILLFLYLFSIFECDNNNDNDTKTERVEEEIVKGNNENELNEKENEEEIQKEEETGFLISERLFDEKLKAILEEKHLKPKKKITKEQLRTIFVLIYNKKKRPEEEVEIPESNLSPEEQNKQYMDSIFNEVAKGLDYDDKIRVRDIKEWIHPFKVQAAYSELLQGLAESMGYL